MSRVLTVNKINELSGISFPAGDKRKNVEHLRRWLIRPEADLDVEDDYVTFRDYDRFLMFVTRSGSVFRVDDRRGVDKITCTSGECSYTDGGYVFAHNLFDDYVCCVSRSFKLDRFIETTGFKYRDVLCNIFNVDSSNITDNASMLKAFNLKPVGLDIKNKYYPLGIGAAGYAHINLNVGDIKPYSFSVHQLIAVIFCDYNSDANKAINLDIDISADPLCIPNHKNSCKFDNDASNLEFVNYSLNGVHDKISKADGIIDSSLYDWGYMYNKDGDMVKVFRRYDKYSAYDAYDERKYQLEHRY